MAGLNYVYAGQGLILAKEASWCYFRLAIQRHEMLTEEELALIANQETQRLAALVGHDWHLMVVPHTYSADEWAERLTQLTPRPTEGFADFLAEQRDRIYGNGQQVREVYLGVKLKLRAVGGWPSVKKAKLEAKRHLPGGQPPMEVQVKEAMTEAGKIWHKVRSGGGFVRFASAAETRWLLSRQKWRGVDGMPKQPDRSAVGPELRDLLEGLAFNQFQYVELQAPGQTSRYLTSLMFSRLAKAGMDEAAPAWLYRYEQLALPHVEVSLRGRTVTSREFRKDIEKVAVVAEDQADHISDAGHKVPRSIQETMEETQEVVHLIEREEVTPVYADVQLMVAAETPDELYERVEVIKASYQNMGYTLSAPMLDQWGAFKQARLNDKPRVSGYHQKVTAEYVGDSLYVVSSKLGDNEGLVLGMGQGAIPVMFDIRRAATRADDKPALVLAVGITGSGKTTLVKWITEQSRYLGVSVVVVDGAREFNGLANMPGIGRVNPIPIGPESPGMLGPWQIHGDSLEEKQLGGKLAAEICRHLLPLELGNRVEDFLTTAADHIVEHEPFPTMGHLIRKLESYGHEDAIRAANNLMSVARQPMANPIFAPGRGERLNLLNRLTILQPKNLTLPDPTVKREEYSLSDRLAVGLMHALTALAGRLTDAGTRADPKAVIIPEAWTMLGSRQGLAMIDRLTLTLRKYNGTLLLDTQNATHLTSSTLRNNMAAVFVFRLTGEEREAACKLLDVEPTKANLDLIGSLGLREVKEADGVRRFSECLMRDIDGNVGVLYPDLQDDIRRQAYLTRPPEQEREVPPLRVYTGG